MISFNGTTSSSAFASYQLPHSSTHFTPQLAFPLFFQAVPSSPLGTSMTSTDFSRHILQFPLLQFPQQMTQESPSVSANLHMVQGKFLPIFANHSQPHLPLTIPQGSIGSSQFPQTGSYPNTSSPSHSLGTDSFSAIQSQASVISKEMVLSNSGLVDTANSSSTTTTSSEQRAPPQSTERSETLETDSAVAMLLSLRSSSEVTSALQRIGSTSPLTAKGARFSPYSKV